MKNSYEMLFDDYVIELDKAVSFEEERLDNIREKMLSEGKSQGEIDDFIMERFDPICSSGRVIAVFRKYWLKCNEMNLNNEKNSVNEYVNPKDLTVDWLSKNGDPFELFGVINGLPYYPIGIDENGDYC